MKKMCDIHTFKRIKRRKKKCEWFNQYLWLMGVNIMKSHGKKEKGYFKNYNISN